MSQKGKQISSRPRIFIGMFGIGARLRKYALDVFLYRVVPVLGRPCDQYIRVWRGSVGYPELPEEFCHRR